MNPIAGNAAIAVATLDLNLVQLLRQAIRTADVSTAGLSTSIAPAESAVTAGVGRTGGTAVDYRIERNEVDFRFERSAVTYTPTDYRHIWQARCKTDPLCPYALPLPARPCKPTIDPPWKTLPYPLPHRPIAPVGHRTVKCADYSADVSRVGRTLDLFI